MRLIKLKTLLQSKKIIFIIVIFTIIYVWFKINYIKYDSSKFELSTVNGNVSEITDNYIVINEFIVYTDTTLIKLGTKVTCIGEVSLPSENTNFNLFNYRNYLLSKNIYYEMQGNCRTISFKRNFLHEIKDSLIKKIDKYKSYGYLKAFILGDTKGISEDVMKNYRLNGIIHLFSVSGMHIMFIIGTLSFLKRKEFIIIILLLYLALLNFPISMTRAVLFYIISHLNKRLNLNLDSIYLFIYMTFFVIFYNPYLIYNTGFIYSYVISFFLILFSDYFKDSNYIINMLKLSFFTFIIAFPINIQNNFYINFMTLVLNLIFIPLVTFILFPLSFITLLFPIFDSVYSFLCITFESLSNFCASNFLLLLPFHKMSLVVFIGYYVIIILIMTKIRYRNYNYILLLLGFIIIHSLYPHLKSSSLVLILDVGQGDSFLITYPSNKANILIDTGGYYGSNIVETITIPTLYSYGINKIDYLIMTHGDYDHMGEAINLVENFKVEKVIFNCGEFNDLEKELIKVLDKKKIPYYSCIKELNIDNNKLYFLNNKDYGNENDNSSVIYTKLNNHKFLFMGDAGVEVENDLIEKYNLNNIDVLKVGHHGSKTSSSKEFINEINPKLSIISVGKNNRYGHPNKEVLDSLKETKIYRTDEAGSIMFKIKNKKLKIETCIP